MQQTRPAASHLAWRIFARVAAAASLGGRYHDELGIADRLMRLTPFARGGGQADERLIEGWDEAVRAAPDHPVILTIPETEYLKCLVLRVE